MVGWRARRVAIGSTVLALVSLGLMTSQPAGAASFNFQHLNPVQRAHVSGLLSSELNPEDLASRARSALPLRTGNPTDGYQPGANGCPQRRGNDVKVSQNCLNISDSNLQGRAQAQNETWMAADPAHPDHLIASYNDYRRGDGTCGASYSLNSGKDWADSTVPDEFTHGFPGFAREYWQSGGDTSVAWDTRGNAYLSCQVFNRGTPATQNPDQSSGFLVFRSTKNNGASWNFTGRPVAEHNDVAGAGNFLLDKQLLTVDDHVSSPFRDRVYVTWTTFAADGTAYIYEAHSSDFGETFSAPVLVSSDSSLCPNTFGVPTPNGKCNENQFSQPFTGRDGALYVVFANFNNSLASPKDNHNQVLLAKSTDGGATFSAPVLVANYHDLPDCQTYQGADAGRACIPEKGATHNSIFRAANYPIGAVDPQHPNKVVVTVASYINRDSQETNGCTPNGLNATTGQDLYTGVKTGGCNNRILLSTSTNGGTGFTGGTTDPRNLPLVSGGAGPSVADEYWQNAQYTSKGTLAVSYQDRRYGNDETTGFSDVTVGTTSDWAHFEHVRATSTSMPPPTQFGGLFYGDYAGIATAGKTAFPIWSDTRQAELFACPTPVPSVCTGGAPNAARANDQQAFTAQVEADR